MKTALLSFVSALGLITPYEARILSQASGSATVTVRTTDLPTPSDVVMIRGGIMLKPVALADGSFQFAHVPPGDYRVQAIGAATVNVVVEGKDLILVLKPAYSGPGVKVSGKVTDLSGRTGADRPVTVAMIRSNTEAPTSGTFIDPLETRIQADGSFEFARVPGGLYTLNVFPPLLRPAIRLEVRTKDIRDIDVVIPFQLEIKGQVLVTGAGPFPGDVSIQAKKPRSSISNAVKLDGTFSLGLAEGTYEISVSKIPRGYAVQSIAYGSLDMRKAPLRVDRSTPVAEMIVTIAPSTTPAGRVFKVSGHVTGGNQPVAGLPVRLAVAGSGVQPPNVIVQPDGSFGFPEAAPGTYALRLMGPQLQGEPMRLTVTDREIKGINFALPVEVQVTGNVSLIDATGNLLDPVSNIRLAFTSSKETTFINLTRGNEFRARLAAGKYSIQVLNLPPGYVVKSIHSGAKNVTKQRIALDATNPAATLSIVLGRR